MTQSPSLNIECLARLDLRPDEILAVTLGAPDLTPDQCAEVQDWLVRWLANHGQPVAGVLVLPQGTGLAAIRAPKPVKFDVTLTGSLINKDDISELVRKLDADLRRNPPDYNT